MDTVETLRSVPLFANLDGASLDRLAAAATEFSAPAGQALISAGPGSGMFVLEEGTVIAETPDGVFELGPGEFFGERALLTADGQRSGRVRAKTDVRCLAISREEFTRLVRTDPDFAVDVLRAVAARYAAHLPS